MTSTVKMEPTPVFPVRVATLVRVDSGRGPVQGALEIREEHPPPAGAVVSRYTLHEKTRPGVPGDRMFCLSRPNFACPDDWECLPPDRREFPFCTCKRWREKAWCIHVEVVRALQAENSLLAGK